MVEYILKKAPNIFSTSNYLAKEANKYTNKKIVVTPFGVNIQLFNPDKRNRNDDCFVVGNIKSLENVYGIDILLSAIAIVVGRRNDINIKVRIAGKGSKEYEYKQLCKTLNIEKYVDFLGFLSQEEVANEWANMDLAVINSREESFGVSALEAQSSCVPVIISNVEGLKEATNSGLSSFVLDKNNPECLANAIILLYDDLTQRKRMSLDGRKFVKNNFEYNHCFQFIEKELINNSKIK